MKVINNLNKPWSSAADAAATHMHGRRQEHGAWSGRQLCGGVYDQVSLPYGTFAAANKRERKWFSFRPVALIMHCTYELCMHDEGHI